MGRRVIKRQLAVTCAVALAGLLAVGSAQAAAPSNDAFAAAIPLALDEDQSASNVDATVEAGEPNPTNSSQSYGCATIADGPDCGASVWYTFQPPSSGEYTLETCDGGTDFPSVIGVYTGTLGSLSEIGYSLQGSKCPGVSGGSSQFSFNATGGVVYHVDVTGYQGQQGSFYLRAYAGAAHGRPAPETEVIRESSLSDVINTEQTSPGVRSGPRHSASFALSSQTPGASFECSLDGAPFTACATTVSYDELAPGSTHVFKARALAGGIADPTPVVERFTIDTTPPDTELLSGPSGSIATQTASWSVAGTERYQGPYVMCGLDDEPTIVCNPTSTFEHLCAGHHTFHAAALDDATNVDPTPATASIDVTTGPPCAAPTLTKPPVAGPVSTSALIFVYYNDGGAAGRMRIEYGPTSSYGMQIDDRYLQLGEGETATKTSLGDLAPSTLYHYRVTITTPYGSATSADQTTMTEALTNPLPSIANGTPVVAGEHAATLPATIDPEGLASYYGIEIEANAPVTPDSPQLGAPEKLAASGSQNAILRVVDLEAGTTYHYRFRVEQEGLGGEVLGPEGSFTTPAQETAKAAVKRKRFKLRRKQISGARLTRRSRRLTVRVHGLPSSTIVELRLRVGKAHLKAKRKAGSKGLVVFKLKLPKTLRRALRNPRIKFAMMRVWARPPGLNSSSVDFKLKLKARH